MPLTTEQRLLLFQYDSALPFDAGEVRREREGDLTIERLNIAGRGGQRVPLSLYLPPPAAQPPAVVLVGHGLGMGKDHALFGALMRAWAGQGLACVGVDAPFHGERSARFDNPRTLLQNPNLGLEFVVQTVIDNRRVLDWLHTRQDLNASRAGYAGFSLGAILGVLLVAAEPRLRAAALGLGGAGMMHFIAGMALPPLRAELDRVATAIDPIYYAPLIAPRPVLMVNGLRDSVIPAPLGHMLFNALREPKQIRWYDGEHGAIPHADLHQMRIFLENALSA